MLTISLEEWNRIGREVYGDDPHRWRFVCSGCGHEQSATEVVARHEASITDVRCWIYYGCEGRIGRAPDPANRRHSLADVGCNTLLILTPSTRLGSGAPIPLVIESEETRERYPVFMFADPRAVEMVTAASWRKAASAREDARRNAIGMDAQ